VYCASFAEVTGALHRRRELVVADHQLALVGHEQLEGADALLGHQLHLVERGLAGVRDRHVEAVVDVRGAVRAALPLGQRGAQVVRLALDREVDEAGHAAGRRGPRARVVVVGGHHPHERHRQVGVVVDQARHHQAAGHVDGGGPGRVDRAHRRDLLALDQDVGVVLAVGGDHPPALQEQQSAVAHGVSLLQGTSLPPIFSDERPERERPDRHVRRRRSAVAGSAGAG
jgi:hypothetical protein